MYVVVTLEMDEKPETIQDLAKARNWRINATASFPPKVVVNQEPTFGGGGYGGSSVPERRE